MSHKHTQGAGNMHHDHRLHGKINLILYFGGLLLFIAGFVVQAIPGINLPEYIELVLNIVVVLTAGYEVMWEGFRNTFINSRKSRKFRPSIHLLMGIGAIGALAIKSYHEASLLILIFAGAHYLEEYAENKSKKEISSLLKLTPHKARLLQEDNTTILVDVATLKIGDKVLVLNGDQIPTDGVIIKGETSINESLITGESLPVDKGVGDDVFGGTINVHLYFEMEVVKSSDNSLFGKILKVVEETLSSYSKTATFIQKFEPIYVTIVLLIGPLFFLVGFFGFNWNMQDAIYRTIIFFIGVSPCALAVSDIPATLSALSFLAKKNVLFKSGASLSRFANIKAMAFDKTGTLTKGEVIVNDFVFTKKYTKEEKAYYTSVVVNMERSINHPLAHAIANNFKETPYEVIESVNTVGVGVSALYNGKEYRVGKPSSFNLTASDEHFVAILASSGKSVVVFSENEVVVLIISLSDEIKESAIEGINYFKAWNVKTVMITGDKQETAEAVANTIGIDEVYANVMPTNKQEIIQTLKLKYDEVGMVGDGINDAPALAEASVSIAMGNGTDVAIDVADCVLVQNDFSKLVLTHKVAKKLKRIVLSNIIFSMAVVVFIVLTNLIIPLIDPSISLPIWIAITFHEGSTIIVILNGLRLLLFKE